MSPNKWCLPGSVEFAVKDTPISGRAVFANTELKQGTHLLTTTAELSPLAHVILRPYRKEACAQCFAYDRGREWKIRDAATGTAFCSETCQQDWNSNHDALSLEASIIVEAHTKALLKRRNSENGPPEEAHVPKKPGTDAIQYTQDVWKDTEALATELLEARGAHRLTKPHRAALNKAKDLLPDRDILGYVLSGIIAAYRLHKSMNQPGSDEARDLPPALYSLAEDSTVFLHTPTTVSPLSDYTSTYLVFLAILPRPLLHLVTADLVINLASRASHNAFSIRPEGTTDGDQSGEFLGWGVWPEASFFNHSCRPNVRKERRGRIWSFSVDTSQGSDMVKEGEQLCITYLGGDERDIDVVERRERLLTQWGFTCQCDRCIEESGEKVTK